MTWLLPRQLAIKKGCFGWSTLPSKNPSICNIIRWFALPMGQTTRQPSVRCSKYYFFFIKSWKTLCENPFDLFFLFFKKITKMKIKSFECLKSITNYEKKNTWNVRRMVNEWFVPLAQRTSILYCRLSDFNSSAIRPAIILLFSCKTSGSKRPMTYQ